MTQFVILDPENVLTFSATGAIEVIDLSEFEDTDYITIALPDFPEKSINQTGSFFDLTSNEDGDFDGGPTDSISLDENIHTWVEGDNEFKFPFSLLTEADRSAITGVRFRIAAVVPCTFRCLGIRAISADWSYAPVDKDTLYDRVVRPVPPDGSLSTDYDYPEATDPITPVEFPIVWRSADPSSTADPTPIDASVSAVFNSGSLTAATGDSNAAMCLSGVANNGVTVPDSAGLFLGSDFTLEAWIKPTTVSGTQTILSKWGADDTGADRAFRLDLVTDHLQLIFATDNTTGVQSFSSPTGVIVAGIWSHIAVTLEVVTGDVIGLPILIGSTSDRFLFRWYVNGELVSQGYTTGTNAPDAGTDPLHIGFR